MDSGMVDSSQVIDSLVAPPGLEPGLSALKGPRVNQLHHGAKTRSCRRKGLVASTGIEPVLSALRGRRVNQLHHDATEGVAKPERLALDKYIKAMRCWESARPLRTWIAGTADFSPPLRSSRNDNSEFVRTFRSRASLLPRCSTSGKGCPTPGCLLE